MFVCSLLETVLTAITLRQRRAMQGSTGDTERGGTERVAVERMASVVDTGERRPWLAGEWTAICHGM